MKKYIFTESQIKNIINELKKSDIVGDESNIVNNFLEDVKKTDGSLKYLSNEFPFSNNMKSLEKYVSELTYNEFNELRDELKKFKQKKKD